MVVKNQPILRSQIFFFFVFIWFIWVSVHEIQCPYDFRRRYYDQ